MKKMCRCVQHCTYAEMAEIVSSPDAIADLANCGYERELYYVIKCETCSVSFVDPHNKTREGFLCAKRYGDAHWWCEEHAPMCSDCDEEYCVKCVSDENDCSDLDFNIEICFVCNKRNHVRMLARIVRRYTEHGENVVKLAKALADCEFVVDLSAETLNRKNKTKTLPVQARLGCVQVTKFERNW